MSTAKKPGPGRRASRGGAYEVGYGKPPVKNQFKKGASGNRKGRPKKAKPDHGGSIAVFADAAAIFDEKIDISERGRKKSIPLREVIARRYIQTALRFDDPKVLGDMMKFMERVDRAVREGWSNEPLKIIIEGGLPDDPCDHFPLDGSDDKAPLDQLPPNSSDDGDQQSEP